MNKILKIGGSVILAIIILMIMASFFSKIFVSPKTNSISGETSIGIMGQNTSFSNPVASDASRSEKTANLSEVPTYEAEQSQDLTPADKKIIKNGNLNLKIDNADKAAEKISEIAKSYGGEVFSSSFYQSKNNVKNGTVTVKVPVANFEKAFAEIKKVASLVIRESTSGQDVTEQYIDLKAQLKNRQAEELSFVKILNQAQKIDDVLAVTRELARVRGSIEQLEGRIKYLESQTDMSTISINLTEDESITVVDSWRPLQVVKESFNALLKGLQGFVNFLIRLLIVVIPILAIWAIIIWIMYRLGKKAYFRLKSGK
jgi:hypothetical protein